MINKVYKRELVIVVTIMFVVVSFIPCINGNINQLNGILDSSEYSFDMADNCPIESQRIMESKSPLDFDKGLPSRPLSSQKVIADVPAYIWRHGCAPTAAGMVIGYWDGHCFDDLIPGNASTQTNAVNQSIASGGDSFNPNPPGSEQHYEDYSRPEDNQSTGILTDDYITQNRTPHPDDCLADFMNTSKSTLNLMYGYTNNQFIDDGLIGYVNWVNPKYKVYVECLLWGDLKWEKFCREIDADRPVILLVDTNGDGQVDHAVTAIGYNDVNQSYACYTTWSTNIQWWDFQGIGEETPGSIAKGWFFAIAKATFNIGFLWGKDISKEKSGKYLILDCKRGELKVFGLGRRANGTFLFFEKNFNRIITPTLFGTNRNNYSFGIVTNCVIY